MFVHKSSVLQDALFLHVHLVDVSHLSLLRTRLLVQEPVCANHASLHASLFKPRIFTLLSRMRIFTRIYRYIYLCVYVCIHLNWMMVTWLRSWATLWPRHQGKIFGRPGKNVCIRDSDMYKWWFPVCPSPSVNFGMCVCVCACACARNFRYICSSSRTSSVVLKEGQ